MATSCNGDKNSGTQEMADQLSLSADEITLDGNGTMMEVTISANHEWGSTSSTDWLSIDPTNSAKEKVTARISAKPNPTEEPRSGEIVIMAGTARKIIQVTQEGGAVDENGPKAPGGYKLAWHDEFDSGTELNPEHWRHEVQGSGWVNNELQNYVDGEINGLRVTEIKGGTLRITAFKEAGKVYSGRVYANENTGWRYGIFEARIKLPKGKGTWPAFWMMPSNNDFRTNPWPKCGEIDIMEEVGYNPNFTSSSVHTQKYNHVAGTQKTAERKTEGAEGDFHIYRLEWTEDYIQTYIDGEPLFRFDNDGEGNVDTWPFNKPFYVILNLAWGGDWGGSRDVDESALPVTMEVDYVRVYQKK